MSLTVNRKSCLFKRAQSMCRNCFYVPISSENAFASAAKDSMRTRASETVTASTSTIENSVALAPVQDALISGTG